MVWRCSLEPQPARERLAPVGCHPAIVRSRHLSTPSLNPGSCLGLVACLLREDCLGWLSVAADVGASAMALDCSFGSIGLRDECGSFYPQLA